MLLINRRTINYQLRSLYLGRDFFRNQVLYSSSSKHGSKLWGGRFSGETGELMEKFNSSIGVDKRLWKEDIQASKAYANSLYRSNLLTKEENILMQQGLKDVETEWETEKFVVASGDEDIHTANERRLTELIGPEIAGKLHTGRSRNDQCVTDFKLWFKSHIPLLITSIADLISTICKRCTDKEELDVVISGYTHLQQAQFVRWSHYLLSYAFMFKRDIEKCQNTLRALDKCPLGCGAIAGHSFFDTLERQKLANELDFEEPTENSMDSVGDRDFVIDFLYNCLQLGTHLSRLHEDLIIYSSVEFGIVQISDQYSTGSSLMPQKRNPDACEIVRGKSGEMLGNFVGFVTAVKGLPMTYNKDLQNDKKLVFQTYDDIIDCLSITNKVLETLTVKPPSFNDPETEFLYATDIADYLVRKGMPFREAHHKAGEVVKIAERDNVRMSSLSLEKLTKITPLFSESVYDLYCPLKSVEVKDAEGGTSLNSVQQQVQKLSRFLENL